MALFLYRLGRGAFRHRRAVALLWLAVLAAVATSALTLGGTSSDAFRIPGTPAQQAIDVLGERFPEANATGATARVVLVAPEGARITDPGYAAQVAKTVANLRKAPKVTSVTDPFETRSVNPAQTMAFAQVSYAVQSADLSDADRDALVAAATRASAGNLQVEVGGDAFQPTPETGIGEVIGVSVAAVVLVVTFGSLVAAGMPLLTALLGIGIVFAGITTATGFADLSSNTPTLALMIGLAVGIDYALFIVSRYRHEIALGRDLDEAAGRAVGTAGSAVVFAGATVVIALGALFVVGVPFLTQMGVAAAATVTLAVLIALTLLPALLGFAGTRIAGGRIPGLRARDPEDDAEDSAKPAFGFRWARAVARHPLPVLVAALVALGVVAIPAQDLRLGMPDDSTAAPDTTQRKAYDLIASGFGPGLNGPLVVVVEATAGSGVEPLAGQVVQRIQALPDVLAVAGVTPNAAGDTAIVTVIPRSAPSATATQTLVRDIRALDGDVPGAGVGVTGITAINIDISEKLQDALLPYIGVVVGLALLLLMLVFRSVLVPVKAAVGFLASIAATFGAVVAVFQWGWLDSVFGVEQTGPLISFLPIFLVGIVFGLAMDYEVFLVSRMREDFVHGASARDAVVSGFGHGARVVTAAAIIMISVFFGFVTSPQSFIKSIGFSLGVAVAFDAFVVRMTVVPAVMTLLGRSAWWLPRWLDRLLPDLDIEGEKLRQALDAAPGRRPHPTGADDSDAVDVRV
ncbi:MAG: MMPL family transporter [Actinobacteria bacterium]|nr:MMPL family transporter [Actinomycetota bacterium]